ncbi:MAG TPA: amidohydrolase family protein [Myxococcales bacterium]|nr:amidohydrolase family protein [Myxococcales bacterium]
MKTALVLLAALAVGAGSTVTARHTVITSIVTRSGFQTTEVSPGQLSIHYEYNDRGRGPKVDEKVAVGPDGVSTKIDVTGVDYMKDKVEEHFERAGGVARWKNRAEQGEAKNPPANAFYLSINGAPEEARLLALSLKAAPGHTLPLLPAGEAKGEAVKTVQFTPAGGKPRAFALWAVSGLSFSPFTLWLSEDGALFAQASTWSSVMPEGFEGAVPAMVKEQEEWEVARAATLAKTLAHKPAGGVLAVVHANLFDAERAQMVPGQTVVVRGHTIEAVGKDGEVKVPKEAEVIDAAGKAVLPGLWDMHVHMGATDGLLHLESGVTSVRDLANDADELARTRQRFDSGAQIGPRVMAAGFIDGRGPYQGPTKVFADTEAEAKAAVEDYARRGGYAQIKVYSSLKPELVPVIARAAHDHGMRLSGHVPNGMKAEQFVRAGADEIQHMNMVFLNFLDVKDTRTPQRFTEVAAHAAEIDPASPKVKDFIKLLLERHTTVDPTLVAFEGMFNDRPGQVSGSYAAVADRFPAQVRRGLSYGGLAPPAGMDQRYHDSFRQMQLMTRALYDAGVPIVAGTDALPGFSLHRELELYAGAGIPAPRVLQIATLGAARVMKKDKELGSIAPGKLADLILVDGDPSKNVSDIRKVRTVIKDGTRFVVSELDQALGVRPLP